VAYVKPIPGAKVDCGCYSMWSTFWRMNFGANTLNWRVHAGVTLSLGGASVGALNR